jgi:hypothetical protein
MADQHLNKKISRTRRATVIRHWISDNFMGLFREFRWSYLPPLMVYFAAGVSGFTGIIESFFVKEQLGLTAAFPADLGFWAGAAPCRRSLFYKKILAAEFPAFTILRKEL